MAETVARSKDFSRERRNQSEGRYLNKRRKQFFDRYEWWFVVLGLVGNAFFFVGSVCFLFKSLETLSISLFIAGSCFMLVSSTAASISEYSNNQLT